MLNRSAITMSAVEEVKAKARGLGFSHVGIARAEPLVAEAQHLGEWLGRGYEGTMGWMKRTAEKRIDPARVLPGARSVIAVAMNYYTRHEHSDDPAVGKISRYAWGDDYHEILTTRLQELWHWMQTEFPGIEGWLSVDAGPIMDKVWAERAGIGWIGKHSNVITRDIGSWVFLGEIVTTLELEAGQPATDHCGTCTLCIDACPTAAIVQPYVVDSRRCVSYLTIEHRGDIDDDLKPKFDGWIFGCDICQDVCPWNQKFAEESREAGFQPRPEHVRPKLEEWTKVSGEEFATRFRDSPIKRAKHEGLMRNIRIVQDQAHNRGGCR